LVALKFLLGSPCNADGTTGDERHGLDAWEDGTLLQRTWNVLAHKKALTAAGLLLVVAGGWSAQHRRGLSQTTGTVILSDFSNSTGDPVF
jgi:hypothetical protein